METAPHYQAKGLANFAERMRYLPNNPIDTFPATVQHMWHKLASYLQVPVANTAKITSRNGYVTL